MLCFNLSESYHSFRHVDPSPSPSPLPLLSVSVPLVSWHADAMVCAGWTQNYSRSRRALPAGAPRFVLGGLNTKNNLCSRCALVPPN